MNQSPALRDVRLSNISMASLPGCGGRGDRLSDGMGHIGGYELVIKYAEMPFKSDEKSGNVGRTLSDSDFLRNKCEAIHKERLFLHLNWYRNTVKCKKKYIYIYIFERKSNFIFTLD